MPQWKTFVLIHPRNLCYYTNICVGQKSSKESCRKRPFPPFWSNGPGYLMLLNTTDDRLVPAKSIINRRSTHLDEVLDDPVHILPVEPDLGELRSLHLFFHTKRTNEQTYE